MKHSIFRGLLLGVALFGTPACGGRCGDTVPVATPPFVACDQYSPSNGGVACGASPVYKLHSADAGAADAGVVGTCSLSVPCSATVCTITNPATGEFTPSVCVRATATTESTYALDSNGASSLCAVPCGDSSFPCMSPATCVSATNAETGAAVSICQFPEP